MISSPASRTCGLAGHAPPPSFAPPISSNGYSSRNSAQLKIIPNGFGEKPVLKLMFGALIRAAERWRGLRFTEFELRQIAAVRKDLD